MRKRWHGVEVDGMRHAWLRVPSSSSSPSDGSERAGSEHAGDELFLQRIVPDPADRPTGRAGRDPLHRPPQSLAPAVIKPRPRLGSHTRTQHHGQDRPQGVAVVTRAYTWTRTQVSPGDVRENSTFSASHVCRLLDTDSETTTAPAPKVLSPLSSASSAAN